MERQHALEALAKLRSSEEVEVDGAKLRLTGDLVELSYQTPFEEMRRIEQDFQAVLGIPMGSGSSTSLGNPTAQVFFFWPKARLEKISNAPKS
jgi:hypothetical protein